MKLMKKLISLTMAVIMLFTATPVLQASDLADLDMTELNELRQEILPSINTSDNFKTDIEVGEEMPTLKELQDRYKEAIKRYNKLDTRKARKAVKKKKQEALEIAKQMKEFDQFETDEEKAEVAFYTFLFDSTLKAEKEMVSNRYDTFSLFLGFGAVGFEIGAFVFGDIVFGLAPTDCFIAGAGFTIIGVLLALIFVPTLLGNGSVVYRDWNLMKYDFLDEPFYSAGDLYNQDGFARLYLDEKAKPVLRDIVNIEYYVSRNPSAENMMIRIFPHTVYWTQMNSDQQEEYLHKAAKFLKEANRIKMPSFDIGEGSLQD